MVIGALVVLFPAASVAVAVTVCVPLDTSAVLLNAGPGPGTTAPKFPPSTRNWTPVTPVSSVALARSVMVRNPWLATPINVPAGVVIEMAGGGFTVTVIPATVLKTPLLAVTVNVSGTAASVDRSVGAVNVTGFVPVSTRV